MSEIRNVTIHQRLYPTHFHCCLVEAWPMSVSSGRSIGLFFKNDLTLAMTELLNHLCMWGGPSLIHPTLEREVLGWEVHVTAMPALLHILDRTRHYRPQDNEAALNEAKAFLRKNGVWA